MEEINVKKLLPKVNPLDDKDLSSYDIIAYADGAC